MKHLIPTILILLISLSILAKDRCRNESTTPTLTEKTLSAGYNHTLIIQNGEVFAWGDNAHGQLGNGSTGSPQISVKAIGIDHIIAVSAGKFHSMALRADGKVYVWGSNTFHQLGQPGPDSNVPNLVPGVSNIIDIQAGDFHCLALTADGTILSWGSNFRGELGRGFTSTSASPAYVKDLTGSANLEGVSLISSGARHSLAIIDGNVLAWGENSNTQLGLTGASESNLPVHVKKKYYSVIGNLNNIISISAGETHSLAIDVSGNLYTWGEGNMGQLGIGPINPSDPATYTRNYAEKVATRVRTASAGNAHNIAVDGFGQIIVFGSNMKGQLGIPFSSSIMETPFYSGKDKAFALACGNEYSILRQSNGVVSGVGDNASWQFGSTPFAQTDTFIAFGNSFGKLAQITGNKVSYLLKADGTVWSCGDDPAIGFPASGLTYYFTQIPSLSDIISIGTTGYTSYAVSVDGNVFTWGTNASGALGLGYLGGIQAIPIKIPNLSDIVFVTGARGTAPNPPHINAISVSGDMYAWGENNSYELGDGTNVSSYSPILISPAGKVFSSSLGQHNTFALYADNVIQVWGETFLSGTGSSGSSKIKTPIPISSPYSYKSMCSTRGIRLALTTDGEVHAWGRSVNSPNFFAICASSSSSSIYTPTAINYTRTGSKITNVKHICTGDETGYFIQGDGATWSWGLNHSNRLNRTGSGLEEKNPGIIDYKKAGSTIPLFHTMSAHHHVLANQSTDSIISWGTNNKSELGLGYSSFAEAPTPAAKIKSNTIESSFFDNSVIVYPIPAKFELNISIPQQILESNSDLTIVDVMGKELYFQNKLQRDITIDLKAFATGLYFLKIGNKKTQKIVIQK